MIELQRATGARPGEICSLRPSDIDRSGDVWTYVPADHKTAHLDHDRVIHIGPKGQSVLLPFLLRDSESYCFSPQESAEWHRRERFAKRVTPANQGNTIGTNRKRSPKRAPLDRYEVASYRRAIHRACDDAFPAPEPLAQRPNESFRKWRSRLTKEQARELAEWQSSKRWTPYQLRHAAATQIRKEFGIDAVKATLGHSSVNMSGHYAELDRQAAVEVARKIG